MGALRPWHLAVLCLVISIAVVVATVVLVVSRR